MIALTPAELDALVDLDRGHLVVPGHEDLRVERVVERHGRYVVTAAPASGDAETCSRTALRSARRPSTSVPVVCTVADLPMGLSDGGDGLVAMW